MNILDKIISRKREELLIAKQQVTIDDLMRRPLFDRTCYNLRDSVLDPQRTGIIAEYKRASPSKGVINDQVTVEEVTRGYAEAGPSAISVLTDRDLFKVSLQDLIKTRETVNVPLLRKDIIIDEYHIAESIAYGADITLVIVDVVNHQDREYIAKYTIELGINVIFKVHNQQVLDTSLFGAVDDINISILKCNDFTVTT